MREPGDRVGAILGSDPSTKTVKFLGYGVYVGREVPPDTGDSSMTGMLAAEGIDNPKIQLDSGEVVWGCECWWGPVEKIDKRINDWRKHGYTIEEVTGDELARMRKGKA